MPFQIQNIHPAQLIINIFSHLSHPGLATSNEKLPAGLWEAVFPREQQKPILSTKIVSFFLLLRQEHHYNFLQSSSSWNLSHKARNTSTKAGAFEPCLKGDKCNFS